MTLTWYQIALWMHLLFMLSIVGALLVIRRGLPFGSRRDPSLVRPILRLAGGLLLGGLVMGLTLYVHLIATVKEAGGQLAPQTHMLIGTKLLLMVAVGAFIGISSSMLKKDKPGPAATLQWAALAALALAAFLGVIL